MEGDPPKQGDYREDNILDRGAWLVQSVKGTTLVDLGVMNSGPTLG